MLRRLHPDQPDSFAFTPANMAWAEAQITKFPEGRQASAIIPLLWRAQEQEGWLTRPAIEGVCDMLGLAYIRGLEVASFYFMFQLQPVGSVAHIQVCGTTSCMICGAEDLVAVCKERIAPRPHQLSDDGKFSWEEVECLGACANAPMAQIGKDYYEDLTAEKMGELLDVLARGEVPMPGPQNGRFASEPASGLTSLEGDGTRRHDRNVSVALAEEFEDTIKRIDGTEVPLLTPWQDKGAEAGDEAGARRAAKSDRRMEDRENVEDGPELSGDAPVDHTGIEKGAAQADSAAKPDGPSNPGDDNSYEREATPGNPGPDADRPVADHTDEDETEHDPLSRDLADKTAGETDPLEGVSESAPATMDAPDGTPDDLKRIKGVGPKLEGALNDMGFWHFRQIADWGMSEIAWVDSRLTFKGRILRDDWVGQAKAFASE